MPHKSRAESPSPFRRSYHPRSKRKMQTSVDPTVAVRNASIARHPCARLYTAFPVVIVAKTNKCIVRFVGKSEVQLGRARVVPVHADVKRVEAVAAGGNEKVASFLDGFRAWFYW